MAFGFVEDIHVSSNTCKITNEGKGKMKPVRIDEAAAAAKYFSGLK